MPDYQQGKIYKIVSDSTDKIYIGSTTQPLYKRLINHKSDFLNNRNKCKSNELLKLGEIRIELIENFPSEHKQQLGAREGYYMKLYKDICINKCIAGRTHKEYYQEHKETLLTKATEYRESNKDKISDSQKNWYQRNKEKVLAQRAEFRKLNPDANKNYYKEHKEELKLKFKKKKELQNLKSF